MKASGEKFLMVGVALVVLLVVASIGFQTVTDRNRSLAVAKLKKSDAIERYIETHRVQGEKEPATPGQSKNPLPVETKPGPDSPSTSTAAFERAFKQRDALRGVGRWRKAEEVLLDKPVKEWTEEDWALVKAFVDAAHDLVLEIRRLAETGGPAYELDFSKGLLEVELPHLAKLREMARMLRADALVRGHEGNYGESVEDVVSGLKLAAVIKDEPLLISQLVRIAIEGICCNTAQLALPPEGIPTDLARRLVEYAGRCDYREDFANSFSGEGVTSLDMFEHVREGRVQGLLWSEPNTAQDLLLGLYGSAFARPWLNMDEETYVEMVGWMGDISQLPYYEALPQVRELQQEVENLPRTRVFSHEFLPGLMRALEAQASNEAMLDLMQIGISIEQYHANTGSYPATLDAIAPSLGGSVPVDPFTGESYHYQLSGGSFLLYSVGSNLTDDGGGTFDFRKGDIVWRRMPKNEQ